MLYLGHFNFIYEAKVGRKQSQALDGTFTSVAEAESAEEAALTFERLFRKLKKSGDVFEGAVAIYLEALVEVKSVPKGGFISHLIAGYPEGIETFAMALRGAAPRHCTLYDTLPDDLHDQEIVLEPFLTFRPAAKKPKPAKKQG